MPNPTDRWLDAEGAAEHLSIRLDAFRRKVADNAIAGPKWHEGKWRWNQAALDATMVQEPLPARRTQTPYNDALIAAEEIARVAQAWRPACGVYFLIAGSRVVYVGQSVNVFARVGNHALARAFDAWHWVNCPVGQLDAAERAYLDLLLPPWNRDPKTRRMRSSKELERV